MSPETMLDLLKNNKIPPATWFNVVPSLKKLCQAVAARNDQGNLQPALNKGAGSANLTIFVTDFIYGQQMPCYS